jgi:hypothetical protein
MKLIYTYTVASENYRFGPLTKKSNSLNLWPWKDNRYLLDFRPIGFDCEYELSCGTLPVLFVEMDRNVQYYQVRVNMIYFFVNFSLVVT